ncbi:DUF4440 domain-containing protein [Humibacillus sp. DSM 29435]|uniref:YybH family protein n=1 Tax=Humibacillus sp. DSM 29435 TaxID=1869167 RepID=UPI0008726CE7|nr:nuclear transport factor 2 family protein [Humibacillus sp. DSM 29435]OFE15930.1 DUF4440 domain-containing protein [Humibacillus sp. DSM 29435]
MSDTEDVLAAAAAVVHAFGSGDLENYFAAFADDATFIFHTTDRVLTSVAEYRSEWEAWQRDDDFRVVSCASTEQRVQLFGDVAVFTHRVRTLTSTKAGEAESAERETIVFHRTLGTRWAGVHEHLSVDPGHTQSR